MALAALAFGAFVSQTPNPQTVKLTLDQAASSVVLLSTPGSIGSGFLVSVLGRLYLVTAEHVSRGLGTNGRLTYGDEKGIAATADLIALCGASSPAWVTHGTADVAVLELKARDKRIDLLKRRSLPLQVLTVGLQAPPRDRVVTTIGYPLGLGGKLIAPDTHISPISRESRAASGLLTLPRADTKIPVPTIILDNPSIGGFSGAPVFLLPGATLSGNAIIVSGATFCVGLVHGTLSDATGGKLAAVVPGHFISETIAKASRLH